MLYYNKKSGLTVYLQFEKSQTQGVAHGGYLIMLYHETAKENATAHFLKELELTFGYLFCGLKKKRETILVIKTGLKITSPK